MCIVIGVVYATGMGTAFTPGLALGALAGGVMVLVGIVLCARTEDIDSLRSKLENSKPHRPGEAPDWEHYHAKWGVRTAAEYDRLLSERRRHIREVLNNPQPPAESEERQTAFATDRTAPKPQ
jgi:hypothetical protein